ncbi:MAG: 2-C-methyl-D-erythritol 4-phosphate cytidylyltransferase [Chloroflexota bacterium]
MTGGDSAPPNFGIILVAAGASTRMGFPKLWAEVSGRPLLALTIDSALAACPQELILVASVDRTRDCEALISGVSHRLATRVVQGGARRRDSVAAGLAASTCEWLAIHDAARALTPAALFARGVAAAQATGAAVPGIPLKDTIKRVSHAVVNATPPRADYVAVQTPQVFRRDLLQRALASTDADVTDEAALVERLGIQVVIFPGDDRAFKVTTPQDLTLARALVEECSA